MTVNATVKRIQDRDGSWWYYAVVRQAATGVAIWSGSVTRSATAAGLEATAKLSETIESMAAEAR